MPGRASSSSSRSSGSRDRNRRRSSSSGGSSRSRSRSRRRSHTPFDRNRLHISDIGWGVNKRDLEHVFAKYGRLVEVWQSRTVPAFAFVVFKRDEDASEALKGTDGMSLNGSRIRVTFARPRAYERRRVGPISNMRCYSCNKRGHFSRDCPDSMYGYKRPSSRYVSPLTRRICTSSSGSRSRSKSKSKEDRSESRTPSRGRQDSRSREVRRSYRGQDSRSRNSRSRRWEGRGGDYRRGRGGSQYRRSYRSESGDDLSRSAGRRKRSRSGSRDESPRSKRKSRKDSETRGHDRYSKSRSVESGSRSKYKSPSRNSNPDRKSARGGSRGSSPSNGIRHGDD